LAFPETERSCYFPQCLLQLSYKEAYASPAGIELGGQARHNSRVSWTVRMRKKYSHGAAGAILQSGEKLVDGDNIKNLNIRSLREQVCIVSQEPTLFDCTLRENICYGLEQEPPYENIVEAAKMANIHNFILGLPQ
ncbi:hypothetical protein ANCDUO_27633, partial [Ancylostoma duodenale]